MKIIEIKGKSSLNASVTILNNGGILVFPTDTVYGIGCMLDETAIKKLYKIKNRSFSKPTAILMTRKDIIPFFSTWIKSGTNVPSDVCEMFKNGGVTLLFPVSGFNIDFPKILIKDGKTGIRIPNHRWLEKLIDKVGPIVASSANVADRKTPTKFEEISNEISEEADLVIRTNEKLNGKSSTVYDLENNKYLRK